MNTLIKCTTTINPVVSKQLTKKKQPNKPFVLKKDFAFDGWVPELVNGRAAMVGFVSGKGYELMTHQSVLESPHVFETLLISTGLITLVTLKTGPTYDYENYKKPFIPSIEMLNGRMAMLGILFNCLL